MAPPFNTTTLFRSPAPSVGPTRNPIVWKVPPGVHRIRVTTWGAGRPDDGIRAIHYVEPGETIRLRVGGSPYNGSSFNFNGGGAGPWLSSVPGDDPDHDLRITSAGYGASDIRIGGDDQTDRVQVAGGRGGRAVYRDFAAGVYTDGFDPVPGGSGASVLLASNPGTTDGQGGGTPTYLTFDGYPEVYAPPRVGGELAVAGAGGGGYTGGASGEVLVTGTFPTNYIWATAGEDGTDHCAVTPTATGLTRDDADVNSLYWNDNGRIDLEWHGRARGWTAGRVSW